MNPIIGLGFITFAGVCFIGLERCFPYAAQQRFLRRGFTLDFLWYTLAQSYLLGLVISRLIAWLDRGTGWSRSALVTAWPLWLQVVFFFVVHDLYIYLFHRAQHRFAVLWRLHEAHHSGQDVDWLSGSRSHPLEVLINQSVEFVPIVLLGAAPEVAAIKGVLDAVWGMYIHSNIDVRAGWLQRVLNGPEMHRWHHATELAIPGKNFATKLALWDWLFGTAWLPTNKPTAYGLVAHDDAAFPHTAPLRGYPRWLSLCFEPLFSYVLQSMYALRPRRGWRDSARERGVSPSP